MALIHETDDFIVESFEKPHVDRNEGGHIRIYPKKEVCDRTELSPKTAVELIRLTMIIGKAMKIGMTKRGIEIVRINYQEMGNWALKENKNLFFTCIYMEEQKMPKINLAKKQLNCLTVQQDSMIISSH